MERLQSSRAAAHDADAIHDEAVPATTDTEDALVLAVLTAQSLQLVAEEALDRQNKALALAAHELRNPLMPIRTVSVLLGKVDGIEQLPRLAAILERQVVHMSRLIDDLLDMSRVVTGKLHLHHVEVDLAVVFEQVLDVCRPAMTAREQRFEMQVPDRTLVVNGDAVRLAQVFTNLLNNASKYTLVGGSIALTSTVTANQDGADDLVVTVSDNGIGITAEALPMIFEPSSRIRTRSISARKAWESA